ncbi:hypothetical protein [Demequina oxidasica]|uniref:hypothetical protein n=1 Tax=Demequina oxidasica TaxID=676199 RepID=UPI000782D2F7|nr:hypothetical protein [Demequina oxidasica]
MSITSSNSYAVNANITVVESYVSRVGLKMSSAYLEATERADKLTAMATPPTRAEVARAVSDAMAAGKDPAKSATVKDLLTRIDLAQPDIATHLATEAVGIRLEALTNSADEIVASMATIVDECDARIQEASALGIKDFANDHSTRLGDIQAQTEAREALVTLGDVVTAWKHLALATGLARLSPEYDALILAGPHEDEAHPGKWDALIPAQHARPLSLATFTEYAERRKERQELRVTLTNRHAAEQERVNRQAYASAPGLLSQG